MPSFRIAYTTPITVTVTIEADDEMGAEDFATDEGHVLVSDFLSTLGVATGDSRITRVDATLDGVGYDSIEELG